jgi:hypothetical protein
MSGLDLRRGHIDAIKIDTLSLLAYQVACSPLWVSNLEFTLINSRSAELLAVDADRFGPGFRHHLSRELVVEPSRHQGKHVTGWSVLPFASREDFRRFRGPAIIVTLHGRRGRLDVRRNGFSPI